MKLKRVLLWCSYAVVIGFVEIPFCVMTGGDEIKENGFDGWILWGIITYFFMRFYLNQVSKNPPALKMRNVHKISWHLFLSFCCLSLLCFIMAFSCRHDIPEVRYWKGQGVGYLGLIYIGLDSFFRRKSEEQGQGAGSGSRVSPII